MRGSLVARVAAVLPLPGLGCRRGAVLKVSALLCRARRPQLCIVQMDRARRRACRLLRTMARLQPWATRWWCPWLCHGSSASSFTLVRFASTAATAGAL